MKPEKPITRKEMYLDVATGGSTELPSPVTREEKYLAKITGERVDVPTPVTRYEMLLAAVAGESYTLTPVTRLEIYLAKAAGQDVEIPQPVTREEMYWFDYCGGTPTPPEREYTGAVPVTFVADGTPLLDYIISGNTVQNGTPSPTSPVMPQGTGERTGNLLDKSTADLYSHSTLGQTNTWAYSTESTGTTLRIPCDANTQYTLSIGSTIGNTILRISDISTDDVPIEGGSGGIVCHTILNGGAINNYTFTTASDSKYILFQVNANVMTAALNTLMLNTGSAALPYEPYGYKLPISSGDTTTPIYLGEVESTRRIKKLVFDGTESEDVLRMPVVNLFYYKVQNGLSLNSGGCRCTHYINNQVPNVQLNSGEVKLDVTNVWGSTANVIVFKDTSKATLEDFKTWLQQQYASGTPVTVWYTLGTSETSVVNEPLMKIGDYADTLSKAQAGVEIPTVNGSTTLDVETTVPPSEIYIKYRGDAVATLSALSAEVSSPEETPENANPEEMEETENGSEDVSL